MRRTSILVVLGTLSGAAPSRAPEALYAGDLVDELAQDATDAEVAAFRAWAVTPESPFAASLREGDRDHAARLDRPTLYAVRATLLQAGVMVDQAIVWTNRGDSPVERLPLALYPLHGGGTTTLLAQVDGRPVRIETDERAVMEVHLPRPVAPGNTVRLRVHAILHVPVACRDERERDEVVLDLRWSCGGGRFHRTGLGFVLGHWLPTVLPQVDGELVYSLVPLDGDPATSDPSLYHVVLNDVPDGHLVAATGVQVSETPPTWVAAGARDFSAVVSPTLFPKEVATVDGTTVRVWTDPVNDPEPVRAAAAASLAVYTDAFGALPWADVDLVETPVIDAHGIEFTQLAVFERGLDDSAWRRWVVAHELAHQWWQIEVGNDNVREPWVDEALAEWSALLAIDALSADEGQQARHGWLESWRAYDPPWRDSSLRQPSDAHPYVFQNAYVRGFAFYDALDAALGRERLLQALRTWRDVGHCRWGTGDELLAILRGADPAAVDDAITRFVDTADGMPAVDGGATVCRNVLSAAGTEGDAEVVRVCERVAEPGASDGGEREDE